MIVDPQSMAPISINDLIPGRPNLTDIYVKLSDTKYVRLYKHGENPDMDQIESHQRRELNHYWVKKQSLHLFTLRNISFAGAALKHPKVTDKQKTKLVLKASNSLFSEISNIGFSPHTYLRAKALIQVNQEYLHSYKNVSEVINLLTNFDSLLFKKSVATSFVSVMMGDQISHVSTYALNSLATGSLLRDVGLTQLPKAILKMSFEDMNLNNRNLYLSHPIVGHKMLSQIPAIDKKALDIVLQHEELPDGSGFPRHLKATHIHPLSEIVIIAGLFADFTVKTPEYLNPMTPKEAFIHLSENLGLTFSIAAISALKKIVSL